MKPKEPRNLTTIVSSESQLGPGIEESSLRRRGFLQAGLAVPLSCIFAGRQFATGMQGQRRLKEIGIIGGVPKEMAGDYKKSLRRMAEIGYRILEGGLQGPSAQEYLSFLDEIGLRLVSCGVTISKNLAPNWLDTARALKVEYATFFWPWLYQPEALKMPELRENAELLNKCGKECKAIGLKLAIHNHDRDFRVLEGKPIFDRLLEMTDPELVKIELDLYWAIKAGADPLDYFRRYPGRFEILHIKDMGPPPERAIYVVGKGSIDFARIFAQSELAGVKYYIVEQQEGQANTMKAAEESYRYLSQLTF